MKLIVKPARCELYGMSRGAVVEVAAVRTKGDYLTPWIYDYNDYAYKPSDFSKAV